VGKTMTRSDRLPGLNEVRSMRDLEGLGPTTPPYWMPDDTMRAPTAADDQIMRPVLGVHTTGPSPVRMRSWKSNWQSCLINGISLPWKKYSSRKRYIRNWRRNTRHGKKCFWPSPKHLNHSVNN
jgi:hypothetical protein